MTPRGYWSIVNRAFYTLAQLRTVTWHPPSVSWYSIPNLPRMYILCSCRPYSSAGHSDTEHSLIRMVFLLTSAKSNGWMSVRSKRWSRGWGRWRGKTHMQEEDVLHHDAWSMVCLVRQHAGIYWSKEYCAGTARRTPIPNPMKVRPSCPVLKL